jgi:hypothetical protein
MDAYFSLEQPALALALAQAEQDQPIDRKS